MKKLILFLSLILFATAAYGQETVPIPIEDLRQFRKAVTDRDYYKSAYEESERQKQAALASAAGWQKIAASETDRADRVQGGRIEEQGGAVKELQIANAEYKTANVELRRANQELHTQNAELKGENNSLRGERKYVAGISFVVGAGAGYLFCSKTQSFTNPLAGRQSEAGQSEYQRSFLKPLGNPFDLNNRDPQKFKLKF